MTESLISQVSSLIALHASGSLGVLRMVAQGFTGYCAGVSRSLSGPSRRLPCCLRKCQSQSVIWGQTGWSPGNPMLLRQAAAHTAASHGVLQGHCQCTPPGLSGQPRWGVGLPTCSSPSPRLPGASGGASLPASSQAPYEPSRHASRPRPFLSRAGPEIS